MRAALIFLSLLVLAPAAQAADPSITDGSAQAKLNAAKDQWLASHLTDYRFRLQVGCFCPTDVTDPHVIKVRNGKAVNANRYNRPYSTVPKLFREIQRAIDHPAAVLNVRYGTTGAPRKLYIDSDANIADEELSLQATHLRALPKAAAAETSPTAQADLDAARALWTAAGIHDYKYTLRQGCFCPSAITDPSVVIVKDDVATNSTKYNKRYDTVEKLFATIQSGISGKGSVSASYDPTDGHPVSIGEDPIPEAVDDEFGLTISKFKAGDFTVPDDGVAPSIADGSAQAALDEARGLWAYQDLPSYDFHLEVSCFCPQTSVTIHVRHGKATNATQTTRRYSTVLKLFKVVQGAIDRKVHQLSVKYSKRGVPRAIFLEEDALTTDDTLDISATRLRKP